MTYCGYVHNGVVVLEGAASIPDGTPVRVEVNESLQVSDQKRVPRQGGQYAGQVWIAPDFDVWPDDLQEAFGMKP